MMAEKNDSGIKIVGKIEGEVPESMKSKASEDVRFERAGQLSAPLPERDAHLNLLLPSRPHPPSALHCAALRCGVVHCRAVPFRPG